MNLQINFKIDLTQIWCSVSLLIFDNVLGHKYYLGIGEAPPITMLRNVYDHKCLSTTCIFGLEVRGLSNRNDDH